MANKFKVKCIKDMENRYLQTVAIAGKVYNFENGTAVFENDIVITNEKYKNANDFLKVGFRNQYFEELKLQPSIHIYPNKTNINETIAVLKQGKEIIKTAKATCNPADEYDFNKGADVAVSRLLGINDRPKEVREVNRKAEAGEWVKIINSTVIPKTNGKYDYKNGDIVKILENRFNSLSLYGYGLSDDGKVKGLFEYEYVVLENYTPTEPFKIDLSTISDAELLDEIAKRMGGNK